MITQELIALAQCLRALDVKSFNELEQRISFQKKIYLLEVCGADLGYRFTWDKFGPYSKSLAYCAGSYEEYRAEIDEVMDQFEFKDDFKDGINRAKRLIAKPIEAEKIPESIWVEILSSLHFLSTEAGRLPFQREKQVEAKKLLLETKPHLQNHEPLISVAWDHLEKYLFN